MPDIDELKEAKNYCLDRPQKSEDFFSRDPAPWIGG